MVLPHAIEDIFHAARLKQPHERQAFLRSACGDNNDTMALLESLLASDAAADEFLETPAAQLIGLDEPQRDRGTWNGTSIGSYRILRTIAAGGMGIVYEAEQSSPRRNVALKLLRRALCSKASVRRFQRESELLGRLRHAGIAQIYEAGVHREEGEATPFFAMELLDGAVPITEYARQRSLPNNERVILLGLVCDAVQYCHDQGVIHRDLKPGNVLVTPDGTPKVIDFGVAFVQNVEASTLAWRTTGHPLIGSLAYMSPEQVGSDVEAVDAQSDVYALGVIAYEILSDRLPLDLAELPPLEAARMIRDEEPLPLGAVNPQCRGDLETIVATALAKEKSRRYPNAASLAADLRRYLAGRPVAARPPTLGYQVKKLVGRHKGAFAFVGAMFLVVAGFALWMSVLYTQAEQALVREEQQRALAERREEEAERIAEFQASQLSGIDTALMGARLRSAIVGQRRAALDKRGIDPADIETGLQVLEESLGGVNFTNVALEALEDNLFELAREAIETDFAEQPLLKARLLQTLAETLQELGLLDQAISPQHEALETRRIELGDEHPDTLYSKNRMGRLLMAQGKHSAAEPFLVAAHEARRRVLGSNHPDTLGSMNEVGMLLKAQGKLTEADQHVRRALEGLRRALGNDHPDTLTAMNNVALLARAQGHMTEAEALYRESLECRRRVSGNDHPSTLRAINNLGFLLSAQGQHVEAEFYLREALEIRRRTLGDHHPDTLVSINNLAGLFCSQRRYDECEPFLREALEGRRRILGPDHPSTLISINNLGRFLQTQGQLDKAEPLLRETLQIRRRLYGDEHPDTLVSLHNLAGMFQELGNFAEAEAHFREALEIRRRVLGSDHPQTVTSIAILGPKQACSSRVFFRLEVCGTQARRSRSGRCQPCRDASLC